MDRVIQKKKWNSKRIITISAIFRFQHFFNLFTFFFVDTASKLYINKNQLTIVEVKEDKFQEFIPIDGIVFPKNTYHIDAIQGGVVEAVYAEDGDMLNKGDTLLKLLQH